MQMCKMKRIKYFGRKTG